MARKLTPTETQVFARLLQTAGELLSATEANWLRDTLSNEPDTGRSLSLELRDLLSEGLAAGFGS